MFDRDNDGQISPSELKRMMQSLGEHLSDDQVNYDLCFHLQS